LTSGRDSARGDLWKELHSWLSLCDEQGAGQGGSQMEDSMNTSYSPQAVARDWKPRLGLLVLPLALFSGCQNMNNTEAGAVGGGILGATIGTIVGLGCRNPLAGAAIGGAVGATAGGLNGAVEDRREQRYTQSVTAAVQRGQAELEEVAKLARAGTSDAIIIEHIRGSGSIFTLSADQIAWLKENRVSDAVIQEMEYTGHRPAGYYYARPQRVVYIEEPQPAVGVYARFGR
jgi:uncharacterized membrane protein